MRVSECQQELDMLFSRTDLLRPRTTKDREDIEAFESILNDLDTLMFQDGPQDGVLEAPENIVQELEHMRTRLAELFEQMPIHGQRLLMKHFQRRLKKPAFYQIVGDLNFYIGDAHMFVGSGTVIMIPEGHPVKGVALMSLDDTIQMSIPEKDFPPDGIPAMPWEPPEKGTSTHDSPGNSRSLP